MTRIVYFVGVATAGSSILRVFPRWMDALGIDARIEGVDIPLDGTARRYRQVVNDIAIDPQVAGAVITTHKLRLYQAARDRLVAGDMWVALCGEINGISKRDGALIAHALDPVSAHAALHAMLGAGYWREHQADVLCLGAGGAATAIAVSLMADIGQGAAGLRPASSSPRRMLFVDVDPERLQGLRRVVESIHGQAPVDYIHHARPDGNDALLAALPPGSLVINATGMGKDRPGSPITRAAVFPRNAAVWDLNYRGALTFLSQARSQQASRCLRVHDGWLYFLHGWTQTLSAILHADLTGEAFPGLAALASELRPGTGLAG